MPDDAATQAIAPYRALPAPHAEFLARAVSCLRADPRFVGVAVGGSYLEGALDEFSDLDLIVAVEPAVYENVMASRREIAAGLGPLLAAFTGEHVGEPRLLICLYGPPLVHVDLKFVTPHGLASRVEDPIVLWDRDARFRDALRSGIARYPAPAPQWLEDRFWIWVHYIATKIGRGELFSALDSLAFLRARVLGPLALEETSAQPSGVRRIERAAPARASELEATVARYDAGDCLRALGAAIALYRSLRERRTMPELRYRSDAEAAATGYLADIEARVR